MACETVGPARSAPVPVRLSSMLRAAKIVLALLLPVGSWGALIERPVIANVPAIGFVAAPLSLPACAALGLTPLGFGPGR